MKNTIKIINANENNLKNISVEIPKNKLVVLTGVSGSGKSTLAFDTIFAEGQRRYMESLSSYARQFLGQMHKPDVEKIEGLSPSISIDQKTTSHNPRSTVGTVTEIYDYLRLLYAHVGKVYCPHCKIKINTQTIDNIVDQILKIGENEKVLILAPVFKGKKGTFVNELNDFRKQGFVRAIIDGEEKLLEDEIVLEKNFKHDISIVVDRIILKDGVTSRLSESVEQATKLANGLVVAKHGEDEDLFSINHACSKCGFSVPEIAPRLFSFNAPYGACERCAGLGFLQTVDLDKLYKDKNKSFIDGGININTWDLDSIMFRMLYKNLAKMFDIKISTPIKDLPKDFLNIVLNGMDDKIPVSYKSKGQNKVAQFKYDGLIPMLEKKFIETESEFSKKDIGKVMAEVECPVCKGKRLNEMALSVKIAGLDIAELTNKSVLEIEEILSGIKLTKSEKVISEPILKEILSRLKFLINVGLKYLTLSRSAGTLSGGESQRIRLATQIGSGLTGVLYILDEPSIGLHQRDNDKLLKTLKDLRDVGNTVIVVEHDEDTIKASDFIVDIGPYAGSLGGEIVATGTVDDIIKEKRSITGKYLSGEIKIELPEFRREIKNGYVTIYGAQHHNLKNIDVKIPVGVLTVVTGVSGSGKSSLVNGILYPAAFNLLSGGNELPVGKHKKIEGLERFDKVINIDQSPIGRTPRSNPVTYTGIFTNIRELFASTPDAKAKGFNLGRFSFNVAGGRCEACGGAGIKTVEMFFLPDVYVTCDECGGKRYNRETLEVKYKGKTISDVLNMTIEEAYKFFENIPSIKNKLATLVEVGLGYIKLGQPATELSGGEAQRVKLATELSKRSTGKSLYILDEPTTGLHMYDVHKLIKMLNKLVANGNTVVVIEHNLDVIKEADYIIDLGPEGGDEGGTIVAFGAPEEICKVPQSETGKYLKPYLNIK